MDAGVKYKAGMWRSLKGNIHIRHNACADKVGGDIANDDVSYVYHLASVRVGRFFNKTATLYPSHRIAPGVASALGGSQYRNLELMYGSELNKSIHQKARPITAVERKSGIWQMNGHLLTLPYFVFKGNYP